jgi:transcriptional regulator with XRE-family HTH domain
MDFKYNDMSIRILREERNWTQEQLSEFSGLNVRTIQRIEKGQKPSLESSKALAAVFETDIPSLLIDKNKEEQIQIYLEKQVEKKESLNTFHLHLITYIIVNVILFGVNKTLSPEVNWSYLVVTFWLIGIILHALVTFDVFNLLAKSSGNK